MTHIEINTKATQACKSTLLPGSSSKSHWTSEFERGYDADHIFYKITDALETLAHYGIDVPVESITVNTDNGRAILSKFPDGSFRITYNH